MAVPLIGRAVTRVGSKVGPRVSRTLWGTKARAATTAAGGTALATTDTGDNIVEEFGETVGTGVEAVGSPIMGSLVGGIRRNPLVAGIVLFVVVLALYGVVA